MKYQIVVDEETDKVLYAGGLAPLEEVVGPSTKSVKLYFLEFKDGRLEIGEKYYERGWNRENPGKFTYDTIAGTTIITLPLNKSVLSLLKESLD